VVTGYLDRATATQRVEAAGTGPFTEIVLRPRVTYAEPVDEETAVRLHAEARDHNHLARSLGVPVRVEAAVAG
jgi:hypothetical protein